MGLQKHNPSFSNLYTTADHNGASILEKNTIDTELNLWIKLLPKEEHFHLKDYDFNRDAKLAMIETMEKLSNITPILEPIKAIDITFKNSRTKSTQNQTKSSLTANLK